MPRTIASVIILIFLNQLILVPSTKGVEVTRAQYVEQSEPICKKNTTVNRNILKGIRKDVREEKLKLAGGKFSRAAKALHQTIQRLEQIPQPPADANRLARWFTHLNSETRLLEKVAARLRKGSKVDLGQYVLELRHNANVTNNIVLTFGFEYCLIQTARYL